MTNPTTPYGVTTHTCSVRVGSYLAKVALVVADPVKISTADANTVVKCAANDADFIGVSKEAKAAGLAVGIDEAEYFVGKVGTGGVTLGQFCKTDGAGGFIAATTGNNAVVQAMNVGSALDYVEFRKVVPFRVV
jgi:hypothetical protein